MKSISSELWSPKGTIASRGFKAGFADRAGWAFLGATVVSNPLDDLDNFLGTFLGVAGCEADIERGEGFAAVFGPDVILGRGDILGVKLGSNSGPVDLIKSAKSNVLSFSIRASRATGWPE